MPSSPRYITLLVSENPAGRLQATYVPYAGTSGLSTPDAVLDAAAPLADEVLLGQVHALVYEQISDPTLGIEALADALALSVRHFRRRVRAITGESPRALLRRMRVEHAEVLLQAGAPSIKEVASAVGYGSAEGLRRAFVAVRGIPPSRARM